MTVTLPATPMGWLSFGIILFGKIALVVLGLAVPYLYAFAFVTALDYKKNGYKLKPADREGTNAITAMLGLFYAMVALCVALDGEYPIWLCIVISWGILLLFAAAIGILGLMVFALYKSTTRVRDWMHGPPKEAEDTEAGKVEAADTVLSEKATK